VSEADKDLDETRRLLYMACVVSLTDKYNLAGTLVNALVHHSGENITAEDAIRHVVTVIENLGGPDDPDCTASWEWVRQQIARITGALGDASVELRG
jgi:hypothetical protein